MEYVFNVQNSFKTGDGVFELFLRFHNIKFLSHIIKLVRPMNQTILIVYDQVVAYCLVYGKKCFLGLVNKVLLCLIKNHLIFKTYA